MNLLQVLKAPARQFVTSLIASRAFSNTLKPSLPLATGASLVQLQNAGCISCFQQIRYSTSFFTRHSADQIWKGVTSVSNAGKKRGRGKGVGKRLMKDLNKGQVLGVGRVNMVWPGLNAPVMKGREKVELRRLPVDKDYMVKLLKVRNEMDTFRKRTQHSLERGWSGTTMEGKWFGSPDPIVDETFEGFNTKVLMVKNTFCMRATTGRTRSVKAMTVTGNQQGLGGFAVAKAKDGRSALKKSKNKAAQRLRHVELDGNTIVHDFFSRYGAVTVYAFKKPPGYGIVAHRCIRAICETIGIKDIYVKCEGTVDHYLHVTRAFFLGLCNQRSFQDVANEKQLHVVELKRETGYYPRLMASPEGKVRTIEEIPSEEVTDFRTYINNGKIVSHQAPRRPSYTQYDGYLKFLQGHHYVKNRQNVRVYLKARYGAVESFLTVREKEERSQRKSSVALASDDTKESAQASN